MADDSQNRNDRSALGLKTDSLATGVMFVLALTVVQRTTGFVRNILFCRFLDDDQLGLWSLAFSFLLLAAPFAVMGLPGSFGRYVEHYRQRGQLRSFLSRTTRVAVGLAFIAVVLVCLGRNWIARAVFNDVGQSQLVLLLAVSLIVVIAFNFVVELLTALRQIRAVSLLQISNSIVFAVAGLGLICFTGLGASGVIVGYAAGSAVACVIGLIVVARCWRSFPAAGDQFPQRDLWSKLVPFAAWVWVVNLLTNLFEAADRYMIVHFAASESATAQALVGQYHSSRVIPVLMIAVAGMLGGVLLPYLSTDWEAGRRDAVSRRVHLSIKLIAVAFTAGGIIVLICSPLLFGWVLGGRYNDGLAVLPWTLTYCIWFGLGIVAQSYLWCAEKARLASLALFVGLVANVVLNYLLLPVMGLVGAAVATAVANAIALALIYLLSQRAGMKFDAGTWLASCLPLALCLGAAWSVVVLLAVALVAWRMNWLFGQSEKDQLAQLTLRYVDKARAVFGSRKTASIVKG